MSSGIATIITFLLPFALSTAGSDLPRVFLVDPSVLSANREAFRSGSKSLEPAVARLRKDADKSLRTQMLSVTSKAQTPPSGDKHDYMSLSKYWWPDPKKPEGKPYIRKDGQVNPETETIVDSQNLATLINSVSALSLAYYFTAHEPYADHAAALLHAWFLDQATRMNPNLNYAQAIPGRSDGRGAGIIDAHTLPELIDAVGLLDGAGSWREEDQRAMTHWCSEYLQWLVESTNGKAEAAARNNHGTWYDVQVVSLAMFVGKTEMAKDVIAGRGLKRLETQIAADGRQPEELARTKSWDYSLFNLGAMFELASLGERVGIDVWRHQTKDGRSIRAALDWLLPYIMNEKEWELEQIVERRTTGLYALLLRAASVYQQDRYAAAALRYAGEAAHTDRIHLMLPMTAK